VLGPLLMALICVGAMGLGGTTTRVTLFEAAMAPQIGASIVAIQYGLNAQLISLMVGIGTVLSFLTLPIWWNVFSTL
jgi:malate permease and related proteins